MIGAKLLRTSLKPEEFFKGSLQCHMAGVPYNTNGFFGNGTISSQPVIVVRAEEALIVVLVLALWIAAIALFFNRWGKIRMLEPYQPKFIQQHRASCPLVDQVQHRSFSKFNISNDVFLNHQKTLRPRQNSVFVGSSIMNLPMNSSRKVKSAFDLQHLVLSDPALNKNFAKNNSGGDYFRRSSLFPVYQRKSIGDVHGDNSQHSGERRLSFKDLVDIERAQLQRCERVQCYLEKEPADVECLRKNKKIGETKQKSTVSNQSSLTDSRHNSITNPDLKPNIMGGTKLPSHDRKNSLFPVQRKLSPNFDSHELRPEGKSCVNSFRRNSMLLINSLESERNFLNPRESIKSGVIDFRRNSMLIINNLTEDIGYRPINRNYSLGGSNIVLGADFPFRRNSVIPPFGYEPSKKLSVSHMPVPKAKSPGSKPNIFHITETKHLSTHKPSKSLDCGEVVGKIPNWKNKKEVSQPSLVSDAKQKFLMPIMPQNFAGSSASLNTDFIHRGNKMNDESRSTGDLNSEKSDFINPKIIETKCCSPCANENNFSLELTASCDDFRQSKLEEINSTSNEEGFSGNTKATTVEVTTSLTDLNITSSSPLNVVTLNDSVKNLANSVQSSLV